MDYYILTTFEAIASEQIKFSKFFNGYHLSNSLKDFGASVEGVEVFDNEFKTCCLRCGPLAFVVALACAPQIQSVLVPFLRIR